MRYRCIPCDHEFDVKADAKPRCPRCMRIHDLEPVPERDKGKGRGRWWIGPVVVAVLAVAGAVAYFAASEREQAVATKKETKDVEAVFADRNVPAADRVEPFKVTDAIRKLAEDKARGKSGGAAMTALYDAVIAMAQEKRWTPDSQREVRVEPPLTADRLLARLHETGKEPWSATSYEVACLLLSMSRAAGLPAQMAQLHAFANEKTPADQGGKLGRYAVVLEKAEAGEPDVFDAFGARAVPRSGVKLELLDDTAATAPYYGHLALSLVSKRDTTKALEMNDLAFALAPANAELHAGRGLIFAASAAPTEAITEFEKAIKARDDAVTETNLAEVLLLVDLTGKRAEQAAMSALTTMPDYARAHAIMGAVHVRRGEYAEAETELTLAERLDPGSPLVAMFWAQYYVDQGKADQAIEKAELAGRLSHESLNTMLGVATIYRVTSRFTEMRAVLDKILKKAESASLADEIKKLFDYDPEAVETGDAGAAGAAGAAMAAAGAAGAPGNLQLETKGLGGKGGGLGGPGPGLGLGGGKGPGLDLGGGLGQGPSAPSLDLNLKLKDH
jgi:tetratricopeptide (TPR) repeat protein